MDKINWRKAALYVGSFGFFLAFVALVSWLLFTPTKEYDEALTDWKAKKEVVRLAEDGFVQAGLRLSEAKVQEGESLKELMLIRNSK